MARPHLYPVVQLPAEAPRMRWAQVEYVLFATLCAAGFVGALAMGLTAH
jgi:hypothetical protein